MKIQHKIPSFPSELQRQRLNYKNTLFTLLDTHLFTYTLKSHRI